MRVQVEIIFDDELPLSEVMDKLNLKQLKESHPTQIKDVNITVED